MSESIHRKYLESYQAAYKKLNDEQRKAVEHIEGPIAVIAGPGTGKTQILAVRIGNILQKTDAAPHNILCLTYTDAATVSMRNRLVEIIGPEAHKIHIYTFHGFANQVIQENLDIFGDYRQLDAINDLEKIDVFDELIAQLPNDHPLKILKGNPRFEGKRMGNLFSLMKKENLSEKIVNEKIDDYLERLKTDEELIEKFKLVAKKKYTNKEGKTYLKGDFRDDKIPPFIEKFKPLRAAAAQLENYNLIMSKYGKYDFEDMISWVVKAFENNEELLLKYQERYHYFLVDEYQDTNGSQSKLLELLIQYWESNPNVFVVGDPDQAIYKFQGASEKNLDEFRSKYDTTTIRLVENYRSNQAILDSSTSLINYPIINDPQAHPNQSTRSLIASGPYKEDSTTPRVIVYENNIHELAALSRKLISYHEDGIDMSTTAILYRKHRQIEKLVSVLEKKNIPFNIKRKIDILKEPLIDNIFNILYYLQSEYEKPDSQELRLFEMMHYHFFNIQARDVAKISLHLRSDRSNDLSIRKVIDNKTLLEQLELKSKNDILHLNVLLSKWTSDIANITIQSLFENILNEGGILQNILQHPEKSWLLQLVSTLFDFLKEETSKESDLSLSQFLATITKMREEDIPLQVNKVIHSAKGVNFITAHSAKGLEFEKVFLIGCTKDIWDKSVGAMNNYSLPDNISSSSKNSTEDERRLFYVAMTRAEKSLEISYSQKREDGKELGSCQFVDEILAETNLEAEKTSVEQNDVIDFQYYTFLKKQKEIQLIDNDLIDRVLEKYKLSVTGLNKYLRCKMSFYFEDILRVPSARTAYTGFGKSIHLALQKHYRDINNHKDVTLERLKLYFKEAMQKYKAHFTAKEYIDLNAHGDKILGQYYEEYLINEQLAKSYELEFEITNAEYAGVPIKGILDKVSIYDGYVEVVDYKTGKAKNPKTSKNLKAPNDLNPEGGDYWRQIVFYKLLLDSDKRHQWSFVSGYMDFVEPDKKTGQFTRRKFTPSPEDVALVGKQIKDSWAKIHKHDFNTLCEDERCFWCNFVRNDYVFNSDFKDELELEFTTNE